MSEISQITLLKNAELHHETYKAELSAEEIGRYARQLVLPNFGVKGQLAMRNAKFLVVGAGGLGCSACIHLSGSGAGKLTIVDHDRIEASNLHRQIMYTTADIGRFKAEVLVERCKNSNPLTLYPPEALCVALTTDNCLELVRAHDVILDCTDNVYARYLLNDACVLASRPLVSASALKFDGQLTVYNFRDSVCRRCLFPDPKILQAQSCDDNGVMGPVPGIMGALQAMEAIKVAAGLEVTFAGIKLHYDALTGSFYRIKLRPRNPLCPLCGAASVIRTLSDDHLGTNTCFSRQPEVPGNFLLDQDSRISSSDLATAFKSETVPNFLVDVRTPAEVQICGFRNSLNLPMDSLLDENARQTVRQKLYQKLQEIPGCSSVTVVCRRGNDSQMAVHLLRKILADVPVILKDLEGGLYGWKRDVDPNFPIY
ncbi:Adenylyltransferase and sulfurtransferase MOCS3 [Hypsibius exemplaris]|uniref:Adenylyltransferase and sulfurtransferase MOCS3 n=1 Tax=Hypsibius exemplaris TaxID=2072580 RepID=A0A1W0W9N5_HYPEX|nr:Adenylyltransferase and sulfurtransferase MOCS3 [Hypsibius exemplaris]